MVKIYNKVMRVKKRNIYLKWWEFSKDGYLFEVMDVSNDRYLEEVMKD